MAKVLNKLNKLNYIIVQLFICILLILYIKHISGQYAVFFYDINIVFFPLFGILLSIIIQIRKYLNKKNNTFFYLCYWVFILFCILCLIVSYFDTKNYYDFFTKISYFKITYSYTESFKIEYVNYIVDSIIAADSSINDEKAIFLKNIIKETVLVDGLKDLSMYDINIICRSYIQTAIFIYDNWEFFRELSPLQQILRDLPFFVRLMFTTMIQGALLRYTVLSLIRVIAILVVIGMKPE